MRKRRLRKYIVVMLVFVGMQGYGQFKEYEKPQSKKQETFKSNTFTQEEDKKAAGPPGPGGGGGGNPVPISGGLWILIAGSAIYLSNRIRLEKKNK